MAMKKNSVVPGCGEHAAPLTRARAAALHANGPVLPLKPPVIIPDKKLRGSLKRAASDENGCATSLGVAFQQKKRAVLKDVSNIYHNISNKNCVAARRQQSKVSQSTKMGLSKSKLHSDLKNSKLPPYASGGRSLISDEGQDTMTGDVKDALIVESQESDVVNPEKSSQAPHDVESVRNEENCATVFSVQYCGRAEVIDHTMNVKNNLIEDFKSSIRLDYTDIDSDHANPQMCSLYAPEIYTNLRAAELVRRPSSDFMETLQRDITQSMRGILIDWLVEVSEEYKLVPDTLYLTVYIIDRFLSQIFIERQRLQLLGITSMLIASKYEEICAPRVEEFCFITDNTYPKEEVLKMESEVLNHLSFHLSAPTVKTFLRRFLRAAQASCKDTMLPLGYLANYLAELTLVEYSFLKFLPSEIAASAVFLARWILDQSCHPWDTTLQHYTSYKALDLKETVMALQDLHINSKTCPLNAIPEKYKHQKFKSVAALASPKLLPSLFC